MKYLKSKWTIIGAIVTGIVLLAAFSFGRGNTPQYFTAKVARGDIRDLVQATGTINAVTTVQVGSQVSGTISKLYVDFNSHVKKVPGDRGDRSFVVQGGVASGSS